MEVQEEAVFDEFIMEVQEEAFFDEFILRNLAWSKTNQFTINYVMLIFLFSFYTGIFYQNIQIIYLFIQDIT